MAVLDLEIAHLGVYVLVKAAICVSFAAMTPVAPVSVLVYSALFASCYSKLSSWQQVLDRNALPILHGHSKLSVVQLLGLCRAYLA